MLAAWAVRVCGMGATSYLGYPGFPQAAAHPGWEGLLGHRPLQPSTNGGCIKGISPDGGIPLG